MCLTDMRAWELKHVAEAHHAVMRDSSALSNLFDSAPITTLVRKTSTSPVPRAARRLQAALVAAPELDRSSPSGRGPHGTCHLHGQWRNLHTNATCWEQHPELRPEGMGDRRSGRNGAVGGRSGGRGDTGRGRGAAGHGGRRRGSGNDRSNGRNRSATQGGTDGNDRLRNGDMGVALVGSSAPCTTPFCTTPHAHTTSQCPVAAAERLRELALRRATVASRPTTGCVQAGALVGESAAPSEFMDAHSFENKAFVADGLLASLELESSLYARMERLERLEQELVKLRTVPGLCRGPAVAR
jgi:hypothetical protein